MFDESVQPDKGAALPKALRIAVHALEDTAEMHGVVKTDGQDWPSCKVVEQSRWREACDRRGLSNSEKAESRSRAFSRARAELAERKLVATHADFAWSTFDAQ